MSRHEAQRLATVPWRGWGLIVNEIVYLSSPDPLGGSPPGLLNLLTEPCVCLGQASL